MAHNNLSHVDILEKVLQLSREQKDLLSENRLADLLIKQKQREDLLAGLSGLGTAADCGKDPLRKIIGEIMENDRFLTMGIESSMNEIGHKLKKVRKGLKALKAYGPDKAL